MCGRFALIHSPEDLSDAFAVETIDAFPPRYNIPPTQPVLVVAKDIDAQASASNRPDRFIRLMRWGFIPGWVKDPDDFPLIINARSETAATKASFRAAMRHRRAILPASGFYEWKRDSENKTSQPYWVSRPGGEIVGFAALYETWAGKDGSEIDTVAILTTEATGAFADIHHRIPVVIDGDEAQREWLNCRENEPRDVAHLLSAPRDDFFKARPVSKQVNSVINDNAELQVEVALKAADEGDEETTSDQLALF
ncbi:MAG: SOS response-associated peptidase [Pseudomonadota bacterium]